ncbi:hypothetical protein [Synechocystis sp. PCC 7509]|uniref:hypothetical protein n=1 Tax=Synechocystis sp. PCC 7509 TaxID=927677 RepID=UPI0002ABFDA2|nr:hypothetical protein [Synechocystis sp. PCC 7509]
MFDDLFKNFTSLIGSKVQEATKELEKRFAVPEAKEPFTLIHQFTIADPTITKGGIAVVGESWQIEAYDDNSFRLNTTDPLRKVILFEIAEPTDAECVLACRFQAKALNTEKAIALNLGLCKQQGIKIMRFWSTNISQTENWRSFEVRAHFKKDTTPTKVQIVVAFESSGILAIKNIELLKAPVKVQA